MTGHFLWKLFQFFTIDSFQKASTHKERNNFCNRNCPPDHGESEKDRKYVCHREDYNQLSCSRDNQAVNTISKGLK